MLIAVISDTHSRTTSVQAALAIIAERGAEVIIHCGDIQDGDTVRLFPAHTHFVYGNCDYERHDIECAVGEIGAAWHGAWGHLELAGQSLAFTHGDDRRLLHDLVHANTFDFLFHGHTHVADENRIGKTRVINPGALQRVERRTFLFLNLATGETQTVEVA